MRYLYILLVCLSFQLIQAQNIMSAEYFFDTDLGVGNGVPLSVNANTGNITQSYSISLNSLSEGFHSLYVRTLDANGNWSHYDRSVFYISAFNSGQAILAAEYFFDEDLGVGNGISINVDANTGELAQAYSISTSGLSNGFHSFYIRTQIADGTWSLYNRVIIYVNDFDIISPDIITAEYFIDSDPGVGFGEGLSITGTTDMITFDTDGLSNGDHLFCVRVQNTDGEWSLYDCEMFTIDPSLGVEETFYQSITLYPNPVVNNIVVSSSKNLNIEKVVVYDMQGKTVFYSDSNVARYNLEELTTGVYIMELHANETRANFKIVKK